MATTNANALPGQPVDPSQAQGAQIPLQAFQIPDFPPAARGLKSLTLTSDIPLSDYQTFLSQSYRIPPSIPPSIESLTLELFSLGYPPGFLTGLAQALPNLKSVVIYSQLFAGTTSASQADAVAFFEKLPNLRAVHFLDTFAQEGFFREAGKWLRYNTSDVPGHARRGLMFLEVNYTFRHEDEEFMQKIQATELSDLIGPGLISLSLNLSPPEDDQDSQTLQKQQGGDGVQEGVMAFNKTLASHLVLKLTTTEETRPQGLRALNTTLYTLSIADLKKVLEVQKHLMVLDVTLEVEPGEAWKKQLLGALELCKGLEQVEIVANPTLEFFMNMQNPHHAVMTKTFPSETDMDAVSKTCEKLTSFKASVLRARSFGSIEWERNGGSRWSGGVKDVKSES